MEDDLDAEVRVKAEQQKAIKKNDRKVKELLAQADEDRRNIEKLQDTSERQNKKLTQLRRRAEEAVETKFLIALSALNCSPWRSNKDHLLLLVLLQEET